MHKYNSVLYIEKVNTLYRESEYSIYSTKHVITEHIFYETRNFEIMRHIAAHGVHKHIPVLYVAKCNT